MYSKDQLLRGLRQPGLIKDELTRIWRSQPLRNQLWRRRIRTRLPHDIAVKGNYWTGNIGNRAVGEVIFNRLSTDDNRVKLFGQPARKTKSSVRIIGGGGGFHDRFGTDMLEKRLEFASGEGGAILAVGIPGVKSNAGRALVRKKIPDVEIVTVRSERDAEILRDITKQDIKVTACPTLLYADPKSRKTGRTGVNFCPWFFENNARYDASVGDGTHLSAYFGYNPGMDIDMKRRQYIQNAKDIVSELQNPVFIPFHRDDERFARKHFSIDILPYRFSVAKTLERISTVDRMVATRFHCLIFAAVCEKPTLALAYAPKVRSLADRLGIDSYPLTDDIPLKFDRISNLGQLRSAAAENFKLLSNSIENPEMIPSSSANSDNLTAATFKPL